MNLNWMRLDSKGEESRTLFFVAVSWAVVVVKFLLAGITIPVIGEVPPMTAGEFGGAVAAILAVWLGREWRVTHYSQGDSK